MDRMLSQDSRRPSNRIALRFALPIVGLIVLAVGLPVLLGVGGFGDGRQVSDVRAEESEVGDVQVKDHNVSTTGTDSNSDAEPKDRVSTMQPHDDQDKKTQASQAKKMPPLTREERYVIVERGTEPAFSGKYTNHFESGVYACRQCGSMLYLSGSKFKSECGWPSFDDEIFGAVKHLPDWDGVRTEIRCANCDGHLGHIFTGEQLTDKDTRHCVNSISMVFVPREKVKIERAYLAGGCFWGVEHHLGRIEGVLSTNSGFIGGSVERPTYQQISTGRTGHAEAVSVVYDPEKVSFEKIVRRFFEIHDPTQLNQQGPDVGPQYRSVIFYTDDHQRKTAEKLIEELRNNDYRVVTQLVPATKFWSAEDYHQDYIKKHPDREICHVPIPRFTRPNPDR